MEGLGDGVGWWPPWGCAVWLGLGVGVGLGFGLGVGLGVPAVAVGDGVGVGPACEGTGDGLDTGWLVTSPLGVAAGVDATRGTVAERVAAIVIFGGPAVGDGWRVGAAGRRTSRAASGSTKSVTALAGAAGAAGSARVAVVVG